MPDKLPYDEKRVLELLGQGSEFAMVQLYNKYHNQIYLSAVKFLHSKELAEEIVQEVFMDVWLRKEEVKNVINIKAFLFAMARNLVYKTYRTQGYAQKASEEFARAINSDNSTEELINSLDYEKLLLSAIETLPETQKTIFLLAKEDGLSHKQIAEKLNLTVLSVKSHMKRALRDIRLKIQPHLGAGLAVILFVFGE
jgi:RNA polymerase sigma-70 factor (family 1)